MGKLKFDPARGVQDPADGAHDALYMYNQGNLWGNYTVEVEVQGKYSGIWMRGSYEEVDTPGQWVTGYYVTLKKDKVELWKIQTPENCVTDCNRPEYLHHFSNPTSIATNTNFKNNEDWYNLKVELINSTIKVFIDNVEYISHTDSDFTYGTIGLFSYKSTAQFDDLIVTGNQVSDSTPPSCNILNSDPIKAFEGVRIYLAGDKSEDPESGIESGSWTIYDESNNELKRIDNINGYFSNAAPGYYSAKLEVTNGTGLSSSCQTEIKIYCPQGFNGTVKVEEKDDYSIGGYNEPLFADNNPKRALVISWPNKEYQFVFWHEASYVPYWEFPDGSGANYQFFEGANGSGELFNEFGRKDENSNVEIVSSNSKLVILKWFYYDVNKDSGERVGYAEEFYYFFPNGLVLREMELKWGYSFEPMELMVINPPGTYWWNEMVKEGDNYHMSVSMDITGYKVRDYWAKRTDNINDSDFWATGATEQEIENADGVMFRTLLANHKDPYVMYGNKSFVEKGDIQEIGGWGYPHFVHWPIGWLNSEWKKGTPEEIATYPNHVSMLGTNVQGNGPYYWLIGVSDEANENIAEIGRNWLESPFKVPCSHTECHIQEPPQTTSSSSTSASTTSSTSSTTSSSTTTTTLPASKCTIADIWSKTEIPDGKIDSYDLSFLLSNWKFKNGETETSRKADIWGAEDVSDGKVNSYDLSKLLACFKQEI
ncbi:MAG: family 16 glycoside hydrolase [Patescibacteria group bacterium]|nr:DUF1080 domain-containing protein [Patescibacteria group bacterium]